MTVLPRLLLRLIAFALAARACAMAYAAPAVESHDFAPRSGPRGATLFATLPPEQTGIVAENKYDDPTMWARHYREFVLGAIGTGMAAGDFDGDGRPDLYVVCKTGPNHLYRNLGDFHFEDVTEKAGVGGGSGTPGVWNQGVAFADVNNDGWLDIYVCRYGAPNLLFINRGDGTFTESAHACGLDLNDASGGAAFCDYDRDGWLDVYVQTNVLDAEIRPNGQRDHLFHNNRDGTFTDVSDAAGIKGETQGHSATWWDYDEDGWPDLYVDNDFKDPDTLYHNNGDGTFTNVLSLVVPHTPQSSMGADLGDINNDGHIDLLVADMAPTTHYKDGRGMADLRTGITEDEANPHAAPQYMRNALYLNTGIGFCKEAAYLAGVSATDWTWTVHFEDLDNDGLLDLFMTNGMVRELHGNDLLLRMMKSESFSERIRQMKASPRLDETNLAFHNLGDVRFQSVGHAWGLDKTGVSFGTAFADFDGDGDLDLVFANMDGQPTLCRNDNDTGHRVTFSLRGSSSNRFGVGTNIRIETASGIQTRTLTLLRGYLSTSEPTLHFGLGKDEIIKRATISWPSGHRQVLENLSVDRAYTVHEPAGAPPTPARPQPHLPSGQFSDVSAAIGLSIPSHERPFDEWSVEPLTPWRLDRLGPGIAVGDVDGDGEDDVCLAGPTGQRTQVFASIDGHFTPSSAANFAFGANTAADFAPLFFDADGDGDLDLIVTRGGVSQPAGDAAYRPRLFINSGRGYLDKAPDDALPVLTASSGPVVAADFNRDGKLDLFIGGRVEPGAYPLPPASALLENHGGKFVDVTEERAPGLRRVGMVTSALWTDVDGDGWLDLLLTCEWGGVHYFHNRQGAGFEDLSAHAGFAAAGTGLWTSLATADFNGDGRLDYAVGNLGLNTRYTASPERPSLIYYGAFDDAGKPRLIEACYEGDTLFPVRSRKQILMAVPSLAKKFPTYNSFAGAKLDEIFAPERLAAAQRFAVTELRSGVFLSQPDGTFRFTPLPRIAQISPLFGMAAGDIDGDGRADLIAVGNFYGPTPDVGRFDGGLGVFLKGDGRGGLTPVDIAASGWIVPNDARGLAVVDFDNDGWPDFFISRNNDRTIAYRNTGGGPGRHEFRVALRGPQGNATGIGARVTVVMTDGSTQTAEIAAGSGYLSQSTAACFFGYEDKNPPRDIHVHWPGGNESVHPWADTNRNNNKLLLAPPPPPQP